jgi:hypothetical protein
MRTALMWWLRDTVVSLPLALFPLIVLGIIAWIAAVAHSGALRAVPLVALVLYLLWFSWDLLRAASGRPTRDPWVRYPRHRGSDEPYLGRMVVHLLVALFCLPSLTVLALRAPLPGWLIGGLTVLPMLAYGISVGVASFFQAFFALCIGPVPAGLDRFPSGDESKPNRP